MSTTAKALAAVLCVTLAACGGGGGADGGQPPGPPPPPPPPPAPTAAQLESAANLLARATFGADYALIDAVAREGEAAWLTRQLALPASDHLPIVARYGDQYGYDINANPFPGTYRRFAWWERTMTAPDQLRQRIAYSLTQIFVVSDNVDALFINPAALSSYYDTLLAHAFGNFRGLLRAVTLHPAMGLYLSHVNNAKSNPAANTFPDENYAREAMQLFTIGLFELNADGSQKLDGAGRPIPTYDNDDIQEFAKVFTGLSWGPAQPGGPSFFGKQAPVLHVPMVMFDAFHEAGEKRLLNGFVVPAGQSGMDDIDDAVDNLFNHPNVGPFIGRQLIQRLVTSNPSPAYVARVAAAFAGNASTPRGDMTAVIRAILLDPEAANGVRLREPFLRYVALNRILHAASSDGTYPAYGFIAQYLLQQHVLSAPSVFNFYSPFFSPPGELGAAGLVAPEFQITTDSTVVGFSNLMAYALYSPQSIDTPQVWNNPITLDLSQLESLAANPAALVDRIDLLFAAGRMSDATKATIRDAIASISNDDIGRTRLALYLASISPDAVIEG